MAVSEAILEVDIGAIKRNWNLLQNSHANKSCAAVVKANAYGLGMQEISATLADEGCQHFFVANLDEAIELRETLTSQFIYVLSGVQNDEVEELLNYNLVPVLNSMSQFERWEEIAKETNAASSILHIDTAMNRLGVSIDEAEKLAIDNERMENAQVRFIMSHLACADEINSPINKEQLNRFSHIRKCFPTLPASLANSAGIFLGKEYHHDLARPGCAIYGLNPLNNHPSPVENVVTLSASIIQVHTVATSNEAVGYGSSTNVNKGDRIATISIGYADGISRMCSNGSLNGYINGHIAPIIGRISMDLITIDVNNVPENLLNDGTRVEIINEQQDLTAIANSSQTIGYEVLTSIGSRVKRQYIGHGQTN